MKTEVQANLHLRLAALGLSSLATACPTPDFSYGPVVPTIVAFNATPSSVAPPGRVQVSWRTRDAERVELTVGFNPALLVGAEGTMDLDVVATTRLLLTASGPGGRVATVVEVQTAAHDAIFVEHFDVFPALIEPGDPVRVSWRVDNADRVVVTSDDGRLRQDDARPEGQAVLRPTDDTRVHLIAEGPGGPVTQSKDVRIRREPPRIERFSLMPTVIRPDESTRLIWEVSDADLVTIYGFRTLGARQVLLEPAGDRGELTLDGADGPRTLELVARNRVGVVRESTLLGVAERPSPEIVLLEVEPDVTGAFGSVQVRYAAAHADRIQLFVGATLIRSSPITSGVAIIRAPTATATVSLVASLDGSSTGTAAHRPLVVDPLRPTIPFARVQPPAAPRGQPVELFWATAQADRTELLDEVGAVLFTTKSSTATFTLTPEIERTLRIRAINPHGDTVLLVTILLLGG